MGEAKRRKQLGLMPQAYTFEVELSAAEDGSGWQVQWLRRPGDAPQDLLEEAVQSSLPDLAGWPAFYRTRYVMAGRPTDFLNSPDDVLAIAVPSRLRVSGELLTSFDPRSLKDRGDDAASRFYLLPERGAAVRLRDQQVSSGNARWEPLPTPHATRADEFLMQHPMARERGELKEAFQVVHHREGLVTIDPEPPAELLTLLESLAGTLHGTDAQSWEASHREMVDRMAWAEQDGERGAAGGNPAAEVPESRRITFELRGRPLLVTPFSAAVGEWGDLLVTVAPQSTGFSPDGQTWYSYVDPQAEPTESELSEFLSQILDAQTTEVTVYADGRVEWADGEVAPEHADRLRREMQERTGAGDPDRWATLSRQLLAEAYEDTAPFLGDLPAEQLPVPAAFKLDVPVDAIEDPEHPNQVVFESMVSFDGETWADVYLEDLPPELLALKPE